MNAQEIRHAYLEFYAKKKHVIIPRAKLVPQDDPTTLFTGSGMQPLLPYLLGEMHPGGTRLVNSQTCLRAEDIAEVGDNRHTTFFEMLGNWSLGDYFKNEQLPWFFEFLVNQVGLNPERIYVTVFAGDEAAEIPRDTDSAEIWKGLFASKGIVANDVYIGSEENGYKVGMQGGRIFYYDAKKNWWSRAGVPANMPAGEPGGPDSEVFYEFEHIEHDKAWGEHCHPNCDCGRFLEIGNSVFMTYAKTGTGFKKLPMPNVDFGGGLERIAAASINTSDVFKISLLWPIIESLQEISGKTYQNNEPAMRVIADHLRAATFLAVDGVVPGNKAQGYVVRRLLRRAIRFALDLGIENNLTTGTIPTIIEIYSQDFPEVNNNKDTVLNLLNKEEKLFRQTLRAGIRHFMKEVKENLTGEAVFKLYDTFGFPVELSREEAKLRGIAEDANLESDLNQKMEEQRARSRTATQGQFKGGLEGHSGTQKKYHTATHLMYKALRLVLGDHVVQRGSNITEERLRFDFSHPQKVTTEQLAEVERIVNEQISKNLTVSWREYQTTEAFEKGALGAFGDKYGDTVKVYQVGEGDDQFSFEICGGPHVERTGELAANGKKFKILKEEASSAGIRRIKAALV